MYNQLCLIKLLPKLFSMERKAGLATITGGCLGGSLTGFCG